MGVCVCILVCECVRVVDYGSLGGVDHVSLAYKYHDYIDVGC